MMMMKFFPKFSMELFCIVRQKGFNIYVNLKIRVAYESERVPTFIRFGRNIFFLPCLFMCCKILAFVDVVKTPVFSSLTIFLFLKSAEYCMYEIICVSYGVFSCPENCHLR